MKMPIVKDGWPWIIVPLIAGGSLVWGFMQTGSDAVWLILAALVCLCVSLFMLYFHRNPERQPPQDDGLVLAGADGVIRRVEYLKEEKYLGGDAVRVSIYLSPMNVHTNRMPIGGKICTLDYTPGKHLLTICNAASEHNEHSTIFVKNDRISCMMRQIVGPIVRRVVYWLEEDQQVAAGDVMGMMKFGSRLDTYLPAGQVDVCVQPGERVVAGLTVIARVK